MIRTRTIALLTTFVAAAGVTGALSVAAPHAQAPKRVALVGGMLLTGYEVPPIHHAAILIEGSKIVAAGPASEIKIPADATIVDTSGRDDAAGPDRDARPPRRPRPRQLRRPGSRGSTATAATRCMTRVMEIAAKQLLMAGVTTAVDLGAPLQADPEHPRSHQQGRGRRPAHARERTVDRAPGRRGRRRRDAGRASAA